MPELYGNRRELSASLTFFPLVGLMLGSLLAGFNWAAKGLWPASVCGVLDVAWLAFLTRGLHLDGVADTFDAIGSGAGRDRALEIMRDSSSGALGVLALIILVLVKAAAVTELSRNGAWQWLMIIPCLSRTGVNFSGAFSNYARQEDGLGEAFTGRSSLRYLPMALITAASAAWILRGSAGIVMLIAVGALSLLLSLWCRRKFGGVTGDILGAHVEIMETAMFLAAAAMV